MRTLVVSDIHSNIVALEAVIADAERHGTLDGVWCLGDIVGYGPEPLACVARLQQLGATVICGNHDAAVVGRLDLAWFNAYAAEACRWTQEQLTPEVNAYLAGLPERAVAGPFTLVHGMPREPLTGYLVSLGQAQDAWHETGTNAIMVGHTHVPFVCTGERGMERQGPNGLRAAVPVASGTGSTGYLLVNPGSVGQPRDGDPRAAYAVYDDDAGVVDLRRVWYDIPATQRRMAEVGLPEPLIARLSVGR